MHPEVTPVTMILCDGLRKISLVNGILRVELTEKGADGRFRTVATLAIPESVAADLLDKLDTQARAVLETESAEGQTQPDTPALPADDIGDLEAI